MRRMLILLLLGGLVVGMLWWRCIGGAEETSLDQSPAIGPQGRGQTAPGQSQRPIPSPWGAEHNRAPSLPAKGADKLVTIDRGPARPGEDPERYRDRVEFARSFDAFVREASLTDEQQRALLLAFYDFVAQRRHVHQIIAEERAKGEPLPQGFLVDMYAASMRELVLAEQEILTREQHEIYDKMCGYCAQGLALSQAAAGYAEPVLRLEGER